VNRILFEPGELQPDGTVAFADRRAAHIRQVLRAGAGRVLQVGMLGGRIGTGCVTEAGDAGVRLAVTLDGDAPSPWVDLILAVPRPKALKRLWPQLAALGVGRLVLLRAAGVEREYLATHWLREESYRPLLVEGLMQAGTTRLPEVTLATRFRPFVEDRLDALFPDACRLLAHPEPRISPADAVSADRRRLLVAVGPEGGWDEFELGLLEARGFRRFSLGARTLRTDTACVALLGALYYARLAGHRVME
jgi:RsmE family RNA methyltransferase